jgi:hypothetical protein
LYHSKALSVKRKNSHNNTSFSVSIVEHDDVTFRRAGKVEDEEGENLEIDFTK